MSYEHKSNVVKRKYFPFRIISILIIILVVLYLFVPKILPNFFAKVSSPFWNILRPSEEEKKQFISQTDYEDALIKELQSENQSLKMLLGRNASSTITLAYVLKKPPYTVYDSLIIDIGLKNGVTVGGKVYAPGQILIGEIAEVFDYTSKVKLYSSYGEKYEVTLNTGTSTENVQVTAIGRGGGTFEIVIPRDMKVKEGDPVVIPGLTNNVFGIVKDVISEDANTFATVLFSQPINIYQLKWVELYQE